MRRLPRYCIALITALAATLAGIQAVYAASNDESGFHSRINAERSQRGQNTLSWSEDLAVVARRHANRMADEGNLYHNPNLRSDVDNWEVVGENVGYGPNVEDLHQAFMNSNSHRANILDGSYTQVGVGTTFTVTLPADPRREAGPIAGTTSLEGAPKMVDSSPTAAPGLNRETPR